MTSTTPHLGRLLTEAARRFPGRIAVEDDRGDALTFAELDRAADRLAARLARWGVGRGDRVGLMLPKGIEAVAAIHGILRVGAAYVPADPILARAARRRDPPADAGVKAAIVDPPPIVEPLRESLARTASCPGFDGRGRCASDPSRRRRLGRDPGRRRPLAAAPRVPTPTTPRTSSTPPARPASPRACCSLTGTRLHSWTGAPPRSASATATNSPRTRRFISTCRFSTSTPPARSARRWSSSANRSAGSRRGWGRSCRIEKSTSGIRRRRFSTLLVDQRGGS